MHFSSHAIADFEVLIYGKSKNLQAADGGKGIANATDELCGIALAFLCERFQSPSSWILVCIRLFGILFPWSQEVKTWFSAMWAPDATPFPYEGGAWTVRTSGYRQAEAVGIWGPVWYCSRDLDFFLGDTRWRASIFQYVKLFLHNASWIKSTSCGIL